MAVAQEWEDVVSMSLTAIHNLVIKCNLDPQSVGRCAAKAEPFAVSTPFAGRQCDYI